MSSHVINPGDPQVFQGLFGMVLTVLIALEFKHTLLVVKHHRRAIVQVRAVVLIALLALVRRFIILDLYHLRAPLRHWPEHLSPSGSCFGLWAARKNRKRKRPRNEIGLITAGLMIRKCMIGLGSSGEPSMEWRTQ